MAREENKNKYSNIEHIRTNMLWMDIKIVDPEMESLMKQINEEQTRLKEALREKLRLMKYDTDIIQKENEQKKEWLQSRGIQLEEKKDYLVVKVENEIRIKEELIDPLTDQNEYQEEKVIIQPSEELGYTEKTNNNTIIQARDTEVEVGRLKSCNKKTNDEESNDDTSKKNSQIINKEINNSDINNQSTKEESAIETRTSMNTQVNVEPVEDILLNKKKPKRGMKRRRILKKYRVSLKGKRISKKR